ncbi:MAG: SCO family protein [Pseudomonadota bacterium]|nr:SCO family protein [Pseudomonadota bacterium]
MLGKLRIVLWSLVLVSAAALAFLLTRPEPQLPAPSVSELPLASIGGPFTLVGGDGQPFASTKLGGQPFAIFFGFTHCPDVCPTTLARLSRLRRQSGKGDDSFAIVFVSVDPERDGPAEVGAYAKLFDTPVIGLTGSPAQVAQVKKKYAVFSAKAPQTGGDYSVDHTASVFVMDQAGKFVATIAPEESDAVALAKLKRVTG